MSNQQGRTVSQYASRRLGRAVEIIHRWDEAKFTAWQKKKQLGIRKSYTAQSLRARARVRRLSFAQTGHRDVHWKGKGRLREGRPEQKTRSRSQCDTVHAVQAASGSRMHTEAQ